MAPSKASSKTNARAAAHGNAASGAIGATSRVTKPRASKAAQTQSLVESPVKKHRDGFLNLNLPAKSPRAAIAKSNATQSPLLRLPAEIRHLIWSFAIGGNYIVITRRIGTYVGLKHESKPMGHSLHGQPATPSNYRPPALHLPRVCRQIYLETALLIYKLNKFVFPRSWHYVWEAMDVWIKNRILAHKNAVTMIEPSNMFWQSYKMGFRQPLTKKFPNLDHIDISSCPSWTKRRIPPGEMEAIKSIVRNREGPDVEIGWIP
ncbi:hypothetical protein BDV96DRAFT_597004 [Lophiotrema nucula]|uniref:DUF7730 domain-containing protein n=1 Tax=Lophiotrema nucula TaxID=690887 RepID=A0A6A5ZF89_9PLEO|nr:hypothetical protein BDV96DRAFT_597004 [Lophiotrema nucula]